MHYPIIHAVLQRPEESNSFTLPSISELKNLIPSEEDFLSEVHVSDYCQMDTSEDNKNEDHSELKDSFSKQPLFIVEDVEDNSEYFKVSITLDTLKQYERKVNNLRRQYVTLVDKALDNDSFISNYYHSDSVFTKEERDILYDYYNMISNDGDTKLSIAETSDHSSFYGIFQLNSLADTAKLQITVGNDFVFYVTTAFIGDYHYQKRSGLVRFFFDRVTNKISLLQNYCYY